MRLFRLQRDFISLLPRSPHLLNAAEYFFQLVTTVVHAKSRSDDHRAFDQYIQPYSPSRYDCLYLDVNSNSKQISVESGASNWCNCNYLAPLSTVRSSESPIGTVHRQCKKAKDLKGKEGKRRVKESGQKIDFNRQVKYTEICQRKKYEKCKCFIKQKF